MPEPYTYNNDKMCIETKTENNFINCKSNNKQSIIQINATLIPGIEWKHFIIIAEKYPAFT
jgi:hypothetical protein